MITKFLFPQHDYIFSLKSQLNFATYSTGASLHTLIQEIEQMAIEGGHGNDWLSRIDLVAGTSIGGVTALVINQTTST